MTITKEKTTFENFLEGLDKECEETKPYYGSDIRKVTWKHLKEHFQKEMFVVGVVGINGYRLDFGYMGNKLLYVYPKRKVSRGHLLIHPQNYKTSGIFDHKFMELVYDWDTMGPYKLQDAIRQFLIAWQDAEGDVMDFYAALGKSGSCAICGAQLTDEVSTSRGIGPECWKKIGIGYSTIRKIQEKRKERAK